MLSFLFVFWVFFVLVWSFIWFVLCNWEGVLFMLILLNDLKFIVAFVVAFCVLRMALSFFCKCLCLDLMVVFCDFMWIKFLLLVVKVWCVVVIVVCLIVRVFKICFLVVEVDFVVLVRLEFVVRCVWSLMMWLLVFEIVFVVMVCEFVMFCVFFVRILLWKFKFSCTSFFVFNRCCANRFLVVSWYFFFSVLFVWCNLLMCVGLLDVV